MEPLQNKNVGRATKRAARELTDDGNFVVTTDLGNGFATLDRELPAEAVRRTKRAWANRAKPCKKSYSSRPYMNIHPVRIAFCCAKPHKCPFRVWGRCQTMQSRSFFSVPRVRLKSYGSSALRFLPRASEALYILACTSANRLVRQNMPVLTETRRRQGPKNCL